MEKTVSELYGKIPFTDRKFFIELHGKNLIITGGNGSGKTRILENIYNQLSLSLDNPNHTSKKYHLDKISEYRNQLPLHPKGSDTQKYVLNIIETYKKYISDIENIKITTNDRPAKITLSKTIKPLLRYYTADRKSAIQKPDAVMSLGTLRDDEFNKSFDSNAGEQFENFLVSNKTYQSHLIAIENNNEAAHKIKIWFDKIQEDLQSLFEDKNLKLIFNLQEQRFYIQQHEKEKFTFQSLSSGQSAIMSIYADLVMKVQFQNTKPEDLRGIVFIDEIDAHLHISIQKKIFNFLKKSFPSIQFIITTHSPFVIMSVNDTVIYDLSKLDYVNDVSLYSYESVLEGVFDVLPLSLVLEEKIKSLASHIKDQNFDLNIVNSLIEQIKPMENKLDSESLYYLLQAELEVAKRS
ncbi:AAA family ATPase [Raoultella ornithinolytica]|uniref:AAA family ATPase n=1 Tax=Raoultella ornithinolytica TaxID=54291 RepID=UPI000BE366B3|nr:AAA family ATPase [Raoultella ornithinolytica]PJF14890.1 AAA family ATPase [Raoultella ornithinolytica]PJO29550.1 AAA family ATPase [Raoultella ornithinolytica]HAT3648708.1 AAA family ATPase [Raoultella ornithinolytica]